MNSVGAYFLGQFVSRDGDWCSYLCWVFIGFSEGGTDILECIVCNCVV